MHGDLFGPKSKKKPKRIDGFQSCDLLLSRRRISGPPSANLSQNRQCHQFGSRRRQSRAFVDACYVPTAVTTRRSCTATTISLKLFRCKIVTSFGSFHRAMVKALYRCETIVKSGATFHATHFPSTLNAKSSRDQQDSFEGLPPIMLSRIGVFLKFRQLTSCSRGLFSVWEMRSSSRILWIARSP